MNEILFVIGLGRSGTTLIQSMLNAHSRIAFIRETHFVKKYIFPELSKGAYSRNEPEKLQADLENDEQVCDVCSDIPSLFRDLKGKKSEPLTPEIFERLLRAAHPEAGMLGDKDPMNVNFITTISTAFPNSKVVHIIRDPRDVIASRKKSDWGKKTLLVTHIAEYVFGIRKARNEGVRYFKENYFECRYEDLVEDAENTLADLCDFLKISYEPSMLKYYEQAGDLIREDEMKWKSNVMKPVSSDNIGKWRKDLKTNQVRRIEMALRREMRDLGYQRAMRPHLLERIFYLPLVRIVTAVYRYKFKNG